MESQKKFPVTYSFELFPPQTSEGIEKLRVTRGRLAQYHPKFFSVTFGAGGSTRERTLETVLEMRAEGNVVAPHLSCIGSTRNNIREILEKYYQAKIKHVVALRGDLPSGMAQAGEFRYASELVTFIRQEFGSWFHVDVAITQYFYNADAYYHFVDLCESAHLNIPIVPGIMPINKFSQLVRFSDTCGAEIPRWIRRKLESYSDDVDSIRAFGLDIVTDLCQRLLSAGAPGLHFYTLNSADLTCAVWQRLNLDNKV